MNKLIIVKCCGFRLRVYVPFAFVLIYLVSYQPVMGQSGGSTHICGSEDFSIDLNTKDTVYIDGQKPYQPETAEAHSSKWSAKEISLTLVSNVNPYVPGTYQDCYEATDPSGNRIKCCRTVIVRDVSKVGVKNIARGQLRIWPNPAGKTIHIALKSLVLKSEAMLYVRSVDGKEVAAISVSPGVDLVDIQTTDYNITSGVYFIEVTASDMHAIQRVVVQ